MVRKGMGGRSLGRTIEQSNGHHILLLYGISNHDFCLDESLGHGSVEPLASE